MSEEETKKMTFEDVASLTLALVLFVSGDNEEAKNFIVGIAESIKSEMFPDEAA